MARTRFLDYLCCLFTLFFFTGCGTETRVRVIDSLIPPPTIKAENTIMLREMHFSGALRGRHRNLFKAFMAGFTSSGNKLMCAQKPEYYYASLDVIIETQYTSTNMTKAKYVPVIGGMMYAYGGGTLDFDWQGKVDFTLHDLDGKEILHDSFQLKGEDSMENTSGIYGYKPIGLTFYSWICLSCARNFNNRR